eukprot:TRINITY_DN91180_c0_g1_i1.p1 TRINITY_DN91180_c0_g1~~TRINITY_DN91180_c0_g1_i1.p1  ORF type:complete len:305 (-),score=49.78 TRINITY_DN91180_c0_g1_i1:64-978(-)
MAALAAADSPSVDPEASTELLIADVTELKGILDGQASPHEQLLDALSRLQKHGNLPTKVLSQTLIGKSVNRLAKSSHVEIIRTPAMALVCSWKESHRKRKAQAASLDVGTTQSSMPIVSLEKSDVMSLTAPSTVSVDCAAASVQNEAEFQDLDSRHGGEEGKMTPQREKLLLKLTEALSDSGTSDNNLESRDPIALASEIEAALWKDLGAKEKDYVNQARAILFNLRDKKILTFKHKVMVGSIPVDTMSTLPVADMASADKIAERKLAVEIDKARQVGIRDILIAMGKAKGVPPTPPPSALKGR